MTQSNDDFRVSILPAKIIYTKAAGSRQECLHIHQPPFEDLP